MRKISFYIFCFFNHYIYKDGFGLQTPVYRGWTVENRLIFFLTFPLCIWFMLIGFLLKVSLRAKTIFVPSEVYFFIVPVFLTLLIWGIFDYRLIANGLYLRIYANFKSTPKDVQERVAKRLTFWWFLLPLILLPAIMIFFRAVLHIDLSNKR